MKNIYILSVLLLFAFNLQAQPFSLDTSFNIDYNFYYYGSQPEVHGLNYDPDGKLIIYGTFWNGSNNSDVLRIYEDGSRDYTWQFMGDGSALQPTSFVKRLNNDYIALNQSSNSLTKVNYYGYIDTTWTNSIWRGNVCSEFYQPYVFEDGSMMVGTYLNCNIVSDKKRWLLKYFADGKVDTNFKHITNSYIFSITKYSSDKLLLHGFFTSYDSVPAMKLCRIDTTGNLDSTFKLTQIYDDVYPRYVQNDGKIIILGIYTNYTTFIRLNADGSLDSTFNNSNLATNFWVNSVCPTTDGGYLIGGKFKQYQGYARNNIAKIDANGFIDTTYFNGQGIDSAFLNLGSPYVINIVKGINDNYYVMGYFTYYNGVKVNPIIRIHGLSVGIKEVNKENVKVFPNPATNSITFNTGLSQNFNLTIFNAIGQTVLQKHLTTSNATLNIQSFQSGMYYYQLINNKAKVINGKFVKE